MEEKYSIVFMPNFTVIEEIKKIKLQLAEKIDWYSSKNALAHITICEFHSTETKIEIIKKQIDRIVSIFSPFEVKLNEYESYPNGVFFIKPSENSKVELKKIMKELTTSLVIKKMYKSSDPHLSIARKLNPEKLTIASNLFKQVALHFLCDSVSLRKFNSNLEQFEIVSTFPFKNENHLQDIQMSLF